MRQGGPNGRRPRGRHHGGGGHGGGGHGGHGGGGGGGNSGGGIPASLNNNRPRSAAALRHQTFDSHCMDVRVRGNAWQVYEKYQQLARDASGGGDRVAAENYLQHAEHYYRIIEAINEATTAEQRARGITPTPTPFGQQPETPNNFYGADGNAQPQQPGGQPSEGNAQQSAPQQQQAEVTQRQVPASPNPFFTQEEMDEANAPQPVAVRR